MKCLFRRCRSKCNNAQQLADVARGEQVPPCFGMLHGHNGCYLRETKHRENKYRLGACGTPPGELFVVLRSTESIYKRHMVMNLGQEKAGTFLR